MPAVTLITAAYPLDPDIRDKTSSAAIYQSLSRRNKSAPQRLRIGSIFLEQQPTINHGLSQGRRNLDAGHEQVVLSPIAKTALAFG